jgi:hypothetical protein
MVQKRIGKESPHLVLNRRDAIAAVTKGVAFELAQEESSDGLVPYRFDQLLSESAI